MHFVLGCNIPTEARLWNAASVGQNVQQNATSVLHVAYHNDYQTTVPIINMETRRAVSCL
eukprot:5081689-Amphidinium_carterae.1